MKILGVFVALSGAAVLIWVFAQLVLFLSAAVFFPNADWRPDDWFFLVLPSNQSFQNSLFYFNSIMGSLLWLVETALAVALIITGRRIVATERRHQHEEKQAIDRIVQDQRQRDAATTPQQ